MSGETTQDSHQSVLHQSAWVGGRETAGVGCAACVEQRRKAARGVRLVAGRQRCGRRHGCGVQRAVTRASERGTSLWRCLVALRLRTVSTLVRHGAKSRLRLSAVAGVAVGIAGGSVVITRRSGGWAPGNCCL